MSEQAVDARIPVLIGRPAADGPAEILLIEGSDRWIGSLPADGHAPGCGCCTPRNAAGRALAALLHDRARGRIAFFHRVVAVPTTQVGRAAIEAALQTDPVAASCFRLA